LSNYLKNKTVTIKISTDPKQKVNSEGDNPEEAVEQQQLKFEEVDFDFDNAEHAENKKKEEAYQDARKYITNKLNYI
jgi:hypothetical protein